MLFLFNHFLVDVLYLGGLADLLKFWRRSVDLFSGHVFLCVRCEPGQKTNREVCCFFLGVGAGKVKPFKDEALTMRTSNFQPCLLLGLAALHGVFFCIAHWSRYCALCVLFLISTVVWHPSKNSYVMLRATSFHDRLMCYTAVGKAAKKKMPVLVIRLGGWGYTVYMPMPSSYANVEKRITITSSLKLRTWHPITSRLLFELPGESPDFVEFDRVVRGMLNRISTE